MQDPSSPSQHADLPVRRVLALARAHLRADVAWVSRFDSAAQVFTHVDAVRGAGGPREGQRSPLESSYCVRVLDGRLSRVVPNARADPRTQRLPVTAEMGIGSYVGTPLRDPAGQVRGMLCCTSRDADPMLVERDLAVVEFLARVLADLLSEEDHRDAVLAERRHRVEAVVAGVGRRHALQPIIDVDRGVRVGVEALARFDEPPVRPDFWFAEAEQVGLGGALEIAATRSALGSLKDLPADEYLSINLSPASALDPALADALSEADLSRVVLELTEHAPVADYAQLVAALRPLRAAGLRLAVDDAGAGYASFRHVLQLRPEYLKVDGSLVRDVDADAVKQALVSSMLGFGRSAGVTLVAEGVETEAERDTLAALGVEVMQGYLLGRPVTVPDDDPR